MNEMRFALCSAPLLCLITLSGNATCQETDRAHAASNRIVANPTNSWQQEVHEAKAPPTSKEGLAIRAARDAYMDKVSGVGVPIEQLEENHLSYKFPNLPVAWGNAGLPPARPNETVAVGTFEAFDPVLSKSHQTIYDEIHFSVDHVLYSENSTVLGSTIDILVPGGTVSLNGKTLSYQTAPQEYGLTPIHRYVLFLRHIQNGDFYLLYDSIALANGSAHPNSPAAAQALTRGKWAFTGLQESALLARLAAELREQHQ